MSGDRYDSAWLRRLFVQPIGPPSTKSAGAPSLRHVRCVEASNDNDVDHWLEEATLALMKFVPS